MCLSFKKCCCCIDLHVGTQVISIVSTIVSASLMMLYGSAATLLRLQDTKMQFYTGMAIAAGCHCLLGFALTYGVFMKSHRWMLPWTVFSWCKSVVLLALSVLGSVALACSGDFHQVGETNAVISAYLIYSFVLFYCACVVNSRRLQLVHQPYSDYRPPLAMSNPDYLYILKP